MEQNAGKSLVVSDRAYVMENGSIVLTGTGQELASSEKAKKHTWAVKRRKAPHYKTTLSFRGGRKADVGIRTSAVPKAQRGALYRRKRIATGLTSLAMTVLFIFAYTSS